MGRRPAVESRTGGVEGVIRGGLVVSRLVGCGSTKRSNADVTALATIRWAWCHQ